LYISQRLAENSSERLQTTRTEAEVGFGRD